MDGVGSLIEMLDQFITPGGGFVAKLNEIQTDHSLES